MNDIQKITQSILQFRDARDWAQYHTGKDIAMCLNVEAGELLELFLWKQDPDEVDREKLRDELADVFYSAFLLAAHYELDVREIVLEKLEKNLLKMVAGTFIFIFSRLQDEYKSLRERLNQQIIKYWEAYRFFRSQWMPQVALGTAKQPTF